MSSRTEPRIPLPKTWNKHVRSSVLNVLSLAQFAVTYTRGWGADSINTRLRQKTELERLTATVALLREEIRIKDVRMARIEPRKDWPRRSSCALPRTLVAGRPGDRFGLEIKRLGRRQHLPIVKMQRAA